uniref:Uncharacterized protein n=1 Tax=Arundo donax TaxID=35708 RepID=A0A0A8Z7Z2_ARUDO
MCNCQMSYIYKQR